MIDTMDDGRTVEVGIIGREGIVGINIFLGGVVTPDKAIVQLAGGAMRMKAKDLRKELQFWEPVAAVTSGLRADVSCGDQPVGSLLPAPPHRAAPRAPAAHHERLCRLPRVSDGSRIDGAPTGCASRRALPSRRSSFRRPP